MAQLVAHLLCKQGVRGSSPLGSTAAVPASRPGPNRSGPSQPGPALRSPTPKWQRPTSPQMLTSRSSTPSRTHLTRVDSPFGAEHTARIRPVRRAPRPGGGRCWDLRLPHGRPTSPTDWPQTPSIPRGRVLTRPVANGRSASAPFQRRVPDLGPVTLPSTRTFNMTRHLPRVHPCSPARPSPHP
jgi:hypothetical protein